MGRSTVFFVGHDGFSPASMQTYMYAQVYDCITGYNMSGATTIRISTIVETEEFVPLDEV
ncbi:MAG: hypothetical protein LN416_06445 [Candidatus Thermoplasmatota archaeon]|nr:hypothetical protein [Candidatus Thermoplasmatota archaeon]